MKRNAVIVLWIIVYILACIVLIPVCIVLIPIGLVLYGIFLGGCAVIASFYAVWFAWTIKRKNNRTVKTS